jgi:hypothetical protein
MSRFNQPLEKVVKHYYKIAIKDEQELSKFWLNNRQEFEELDKTLPPLEEDKVYTPAEQRELHWLRCTQYTLAGPPKAKSNIEAGSFSMKPRDFVASLVDNQPVKMPSGMIIASVRTAAHNAGVKIKTQFAAGQWVVMKISKTL